MKLKVNQIHYINQLDYAHLSYPTTLERGGALREPYPSVAAAGCGLCCVCMMVEGMTGTPLSLEQCVELSAASGANVFGTDMKRLGAMVAQKYNLSMETGNSVGELLLCLSDGGCAILNAGRPSGVFSDGGHYLLAVRADKEIVWMFDPSLTKEKYERPDRWSQVVLWEDYVLAPVEVIERECRNREPSYYLFRPGRKF